MLRVIMNTRFASPLAVVVSMLLVAIEIAACGDTRTPRGTGELDASTSDDASMSTDAADTDAMSEPDASRDGGRADLGSDGGVITDAGHDDGGDVDSGSVDAGTPGWTTETVITFASATGPLVEESVAIARDAADGIHLAYADYVSLHVQYAVRGVSGWESEPVAPTTAIGSPFALAVTTDGTPMVTGVDNETGDLVYASRVGGEWESTVIAPNGGASSLAVDSAGKPRIAWVDSDVNALKYAAWTGSEWTVEVVLTVDAAPEAPSLQLDRDGRPSIVFHDPVDYSVRWVRYDGAEWVQAFIQLGSVADLGGHPSHAFTADNRAVVVFGNVYDELAYHIRNLDGGYMTVSTASLRGDGIDQTLAIGSDGLFRIAFSDKFSHVLRLGVVDELSEGYPTVEDADATTGVAVQHAMVLDSHDVAHIAYIDSLSHSVRYTTQAPH